MYHYDDRGRAVHRILWKTDFHCHLKHQSQLVARVLWPCVRVTGWTVLAAVADRYSRDCKCNVRQTNVWRVSRTCHVRFSWSQVAARNVRCPLELVLRWTWNRRSFTVRMTVLTSAPWVTCKSIIPTFIIASRQCHGKLLVFSLNNK